MTVDHEARERHRARASAFGRGIAQEIMDAASRVLYGAEPEVPETLYHYTRALVPESIIRTGQLFATHYAELNDHTEVVHLMSLAHSGYSRWADRRPVVRDNQVVCDSADEAAEIALWRVLNMTPRTDAVPYVVSLTTMDDDIQQWRSYGDNGYGACLAFRTTDMEKLLRTRSGLHGYPVQLVPVVYDDPVKQQMRGGRSPCREYIGSARPWAHPTHDMCAAAIAQAPAKGHDGCMLLFLLACGGQSGEEGIEPVDVEYPYSIDLGGGLVVDDVMPIVVAFKEPSEACEVPNQVWFASDDDTLLVSAPFTDALEGSHDLATECVPSDGGGGGEPGCSRSALTFDVDGVSFHGVTGTLEVAAAADRSEVTVSLSDIVAETVGGETRVVSGALTTTPEVYCFNVTSEPSRRPATSRAISSGETGRPSAAWNRSETGTTSSTQPETGGWFVNGGCDAVFAGSLSVHARRISMCLRARAILAPSPRRLRRGAHVPGAHGRGLHLRLCFVRPGQFGRLRPN